MAFKSDPEQLRTWDPDTGWEFKLSRWRDGEITCRLFHPDKRGFRAEGECSIEDTGKLTPDGQLIALFDYRIDTIDGKFPHKASAETRRMIEEALSAYGLVHSGPVPIRVTYATP